jgi:DNA polymerase/3'-5' exonuclease PolX
VDNATIAKVFNEMAELLEFRGENPFRIRAYRNGAKAIAELDESVESILADPERDLSKVPGIGKTLLDKTETLVSTGTLPQLIELRKQVPPVVIEMARIPGLGAKKAAKLQQELAIESLADLRKACHEDRVGKLPGFGAKTQQAILDGLEIAEAAAERVYWSEGDALAADIADHMSTCKSVERMQWAGSYRRGRETVGDLDLLVVASDRAIAMDHLEAYSDRSQTIGRGDTKISIRVGKAFQVDMRIVEADQFGAALQYFTGSQAHNIHTRRLAKEQGLKINEYGIFNIDDDSRVAGETEEEVYAAIGLPWIDPELRDEYRDRLVILKGIECDILERGGMDLPDKCLAEADWVLASVHYGQKQPRDQITERILGAIENPYVTCIAHPTGRLINRRSPYEVDMEAVMKAAKETGTLLELNANPARLDLNDIHLAQARRVGIPIVISTDAHSTDGMHVMRFGIKQARRGGLTRDDVANTRDWSEMRKLLKKRG